MLLLAILAALVIGFFLLEWIVTILTVAVYIGWHLLGWMLTGWRVVALIIIILLLVIV